MALTQILVVSDLGASVTWYREVLGARFHSEYGGTSAVFEGRGAEFLTPPYEWEHETRCFFRDPDGHLFEISQV